MSTDKHVQSLMLADDIYYSLLLYSDYGVFTAFNSWCIAKNKCV